MGYEISYKGDNSDRRALNDFVHYVGLTPAKLLIRLLRAAKTLADIDRADFYCGFAGVQGEPVRALIRHIHGLPIFVAWQNSDNNDLTLLSSIKDFPHA